MNNLPDVVQIPANFPLNVLEQPILYAPPPGLHMPPPGLFEPHVNNALPNVPNNIEAIPLIRQPYVYKPKAIPRKDRGVLNVPHKNAKTFDNIIECLSTNMHIFDRIYNNNLIEYANSVIIIEYLDLKLCPIFHAFIIVTLYKEMTLNIGNNSDMKHRMFHYNRLYNAYVTISGGLKKFINYTRSKAEGIWNINANIINMELLNSNNIKIPMCKKNSESFRTIIHTIDLNGNDISLNVKNYKMYVGPIFSRLTGEPNEENNSIAIMFEPIFKEILNGVTMPEIMLKYPQEYGMAMNARKNLIRLHGTTCVINPKESNFFLERLDFEFRANRPIDLINDKIVTFGRKKTSPPKFMVPSFTRTARCPCIQNIEKAHPITGVMSETVICCNRVFDLGDINTREEILKTFNPNNSALGNIQENYNKLMFWFSPYIKNKERLTPTCPFCMTKFDNIEGLNNYQGKEPLLKHPTDVICPNCNKDFCTDCKKQHPDELCTGMPRLPDGTFDWLYQSCPGCTTTIERTVGCTFMKCKALPIIDGIERICGAEWCWICRCIRLPEFNRETHHYCLVNDDYNNTDPNFKPRWTHNSRWIENPNLWKEQTKMKPLNRGHVIGSELVV